MRRLVIQPGCRGAHLEMDTYVDAFNSFLTVTDEKEVLANAIIREMKRYDVRSLLDVGAGSGELSGQLATVVDQFSMCSA
jgi:2-polyprenyl-3-methyl-5-hydroxy-6-metoxy-1,4-benzoquinol methylase